MKTLRELKNFGFEIRFVSSEESEGLPYMYGSYDDVTGIYLTTSEIDMLKEHDSEEFVEQYIDVPIDIYLQEYLEPIHNERLDAILKFINTK